MPPLLLTAAPVEYAAALPATLQVHARTPHTHNCPSCGHLHLVRGGAGRHLRLHAWDTDGLRKAALVTTLVNPPFAHTFVVAYLLPHISLAPRLLQAKGPTKPAMQDRHVAINDPSGSMLWSMAPPEMASVLQRRSASPAPFAVTAIFDGHGAGEHSAHTAAESTLQAIAGHADVLAALSEFWASGSRTAACMQRASLRQSAPCVRAVCMGQLSYLRASRVMACYQQGRAPSPLFPPLLRWWG